MNNKKMKILMLTVLMGTSYGAFAFVDTWSLGDCEVQAGEVMDVTPTCNNDAALAQMNTALTNTTTAINNYKPNPQGTTLTQSNLTPTQVLIPDDKAAAGSTSTNSGGAWGSGTSTTQSSP